MPAGGAADGRLGVVSPFDGLWELAGAGGASVDGVSSRFTAGGVFTGAGADEDGDTGVGAGRGGAGCGRAAAGSLAGLGAGGTSGAWVVPVDGMLVRGVEDEGVAGAGRGADAASRDGAGVGLFSTAGEATGGVVGDPADGALPAVVPVAAGDGAGARDGDVPDGLGAGAETVGVAVAGAGDGRDVSLDPVFATAGAGDGDFTAGASPVRSSDDALGAGEDAVGVPDAGDGADPPDVSGLPDGDEAASEGRGDGRADGVRDASPEALAGACVDLPGAPAVSGAWEVDGRCGRSECGLDGLSV